MDKYINRALLNIAIDDAAEEYRFSIDALAGVTRPEDPLCGGEGSVFYALSDLRDGELPTFLQTFQHKNLLQEPHRLILQWDAILRDKPATPLQKQCIQPKINAWQAFHRVIHEKENARLAEGEVYGDYRVIKK